VQGKKLTTYQFTPNELRHNLSEFIKEKYNYEPLLYLHFSPASSLPVCVDFEREDSDEFYTFFLALQEDLFSIKDKEQGGEYELGDKLLQLYLGFDIEEYLFKSGCNDYDCEMYNDEGSIYIVCNNKPITYTSHVYVEEKIEKLRKKLTRFSFPINDFKPFGTSHFSLTEFFHDREANTINLSYTGNNIDNLSILVRIIGEEKKLSVSIQANGFFDQEEISNEAKKISQNVYDYFHTYFLKIKNVRIRHLYHNIIEFINSVYHIPVSIEKIDRLTMLENVVLSLSKSGYSYQEIGDLIDRSKKAIDNTLLRIRNKDEAYNLGLFSKR